MTTRTFPGMYALRLPFMASETDDGGEHDDPLDPAFIEQPGDREPEGGDTGDDTQTATGDETETDDSGGDDTVSGAAGDDDTGGDTGTGSDDTGGDDEPAKPKKDWRDRQIIKARAAEKKEREEKAALAAENAELKARLAGDGEGATVLTEAERAKIRSEAVNEVRTQERFQKINQGADAMFEAGSKAFPKTWAQRVADASEVFSDEIRAKPEFLEAVTELENSAAVYHELAGDPDKMEEVLNLPPHKMGMELARISAKLATKAPKAISRTPAPIKPLDKPGREERSLDDPNLSMDEFDRLMRIEEKKAAQKVQERRGY